MTPTSTRPSPQVMIPVLLRENPAARAVLDRYGLRRCGGPNGPHESLEVFARAHDVPLDGLLAELGAADTAPPAADPPPPRWSADAIYRPFFLAGIAVVLTLGAVWGAYLLAADRPRRAVHGGRACTRSTPTGTPRSSAGSACSSWGSPTRRSPASSTRRSPSRAWPT